jgi:hypothetical protein
MLPVPHLAVFALLTPRSRLRRCRPLCSRFRASGAVGVVEVRDLRRQDLEDAERSIAGALVGSAHPVAVLADFRVGG